jgi:hypothetical protein
MKLPPLLAVLALGILLPAAAAAEPSPADRATARALGLEGEAALDGQDYVKAADRFARADALFHAPTLLLGLARAQVGLGKLVEAQETYRRVVSEPVPPGAPPIFLEAVADAQKEMAAVEPRIAWLIITVTGASAATVQLDEAVLSPAALGVRRATNPGTHQIRASGEGGSAKKTSVTLAEGKTETIALDLTPLEAAPAVAPPSPPPVIGAPAAPPGSRTPAYVLFGAGGASAIVGAVFTGMAASSYQAFNAHPTASGADQTVRNARIADATWASAGALGAAGLVVLLVMRGSDPSKASPEASASERPFVTPWVGMTAGGLSASFRF